MPKELPPLDPLELLCPLCEGEVKIHLFWEHESGEYGTILAQWPEVDEIEQITCRCDPALPFHDAWTDILNDWIAGPSPCPLCDKDLKLYPNDHMMCRAEAEVLWIGYDGYVIFGDEDLTALQILANIAHDNFNQMISGTWDHRDETIYRQALDRVRAKLDAIPVLPSDGLL